MAGADSGVKVTLLTKRHGVLTGEEFPVASGAVIGRFDASAGPVDVDLTGLPESNTVSRRHAVIFHDAGGDWYVRDLGSTNGVFIRRAGSSDYGPCVREPQPLRDGDEIAFGNAKFVSRLEPSLLGLRQ